MREPQNRNRDEAAAFARIEAATLERRRKEFRETTPGERLEQALELSDLARELREGYLRANKR